MQLSKMLSLMVVPHCQLFYILRKDEDEKVICLCLIIAFDAIVCSNALGLNQVQLDEKSIMIHVYYDYKTWLNKLIFCYNKTLHSDFSPRKNNKKLLLANK